MITTFELFKIVPFEYQSRSNLLTIVYYVHKVCGICRTFKKVKELISMFMKYFRLISSSQPTARFSVQNLTVLGLSVRLLIFHIFIFLSRTTGLILIKLDVNRQNRNYFLSLFPAQISSKPNICHSTTFQTSLYQNCQLQWLYIC